MKDSFVQKMAKFLLEHPKKLIFLSIVSTVLLAIGLKDLQTDFSYRIWFRTTDPLIKVYDDFERKFGNDDTVVILIHSPSGVFDSDTINLTRKVTEQLWQVPDIIRVDSITNYQWTHSKDDDLLVEDFIPEEFNEQLLEKRKKIAITHEVIPDYLINKEANVALVYAKIRPFPGSVPNDQKIIQKTKEFIEPFRNISDHTLYINGSTTINNTFKDVAEKDTSTILPFAFLLILIFLIYFFRSFWGVAVPFLIIGLTLIIVFGISGLIGIKFNNITTMIPTIITAIAIADTVHILVTYLQFRKQGLDKYNATYESFVKNITPTFLTSISTAAGFLSFSQADLIPLANLGILAAIGTMVAWILTMTFVAPILSIVSFKISQKKDVKKLASESYAPKLLSKISSKKKIITYGTFILFILSIYIGLKNEVNSNPYSYFSKSVPLRVANDFGLKMLGGVTGPEIVIDTKKDDGIKKYSFLSKVEEFENWLQEKKYVNKVISVIDIIKSMNRSLNGDKEEFYKIPKDDKAIAELLFLYTMSLPEGMDLNDRITIQNDAIRLTILWSAQDSKSALKYFDEFTAKAKSLGLDATVTGKIPLYQGMNDLVVETFFTSIAMAILGISIILIIAFRSFKIGLFSMLPNIIPLGFGAAVMTFLGKPIDIGTALVTSVCLGIVVDDTIHFLANFHKYKTSGMSNEKAVLNVLTYTGPALFTTTLILMVGFGVMMLANFIPNINFGLFTAIILGFALLVDVIFLPAILILKDSSE